MQRRDFLALSAAALTVLPLTAGTAAAGETVEFMEDGDVQALLDQGKTVFVDFYTTWCSTCRAQERAIEALRKANPAYDESLVFVKVDWDVHSRSKLARRLAIPRRSTLVVLKGDKELGRIVAGTASSQIKALMDTGLSAAS